MPKAPELIVYYNTKCPVCNAGIRAQDNKLLQAAKAGIIEFRDINLEPEALVKFGARLDDIRRRLHAVGRDGYLIVGADVFLAMWRLTPGDGWKAKVLDNPAFRPLTRFAYDRFADLLFAWNRRHARF